MSNRLPLTWLCISLVCSLGCGNGATPATIASESHAPSVAAGTSAPISDVAPAALRWRSEASGVTDPLVAIDGSAGNVWIASSHGILHGVGDGSWRVVKQSDNDEHRALLVDGTDIYVAGMPCTGGVCQGGFVERSCDGGLTWERTTFASAAAGLSSDGHDVYLVLDGELRVASDGFASPRPIPLPAARGIHASGGELLAFGGLRDLMIAASSDGGQTWSSVYDAPGGSKSGHVDAMWSAGKIMFAAGNGASVPASMGALLRSSDGGGSWQTVMLPAMDRASSVWGSAADDVYVLGSQLLHSRDGASFSTVTLSAGTWQVVWGTSARDLYVIGFGGAILHGTR